MIARPEPLSRAAFAEWLDPPVWGMVHLPPLPGSPGYGGRPGEAAQRGLADVEVLVAAGYRGVVVENYGDLPFFPDRVPAITVAALTRVVGSVRDRWPDLRIGVNCLRNDAEAALAVAAATGADAIRVNIHVGAAVTDQGLLQGRAAETLRGRAGLEADVRILADLAVKHATPLAARPLPEEAADARTRGLADALLVTGAGTGQPADPSGLELVRAGAPDAPVLVASGVTEATALEWSRLADGAIVGSAIMHDGKAGAGIDPARAERLLRARTR